MSNLPSAVVIALLIASISACFAHFSVLATSVPSSDALTSLTLAFASSILAWRSALAWAFSASAFFSATAFLTSANLSAWAL